MIPIGQPYRPAGALDARSILITSILGTTAAVIGAAFVWLWEWSPIPTLLLLTPILQGLAVGAVMAFAVGRLRMRNPRIVATVGFVCGLLSIGLVHYGHYLHMVSAAAAQLRIEIVQDQTIAADQRQLLLAKLDADPSQFVNAMLVQQTQHSGFLGSLFLRNAQGVRLKSSVVTGTMLWILWAGEALLAAAMAAGIPMDRAAAPFCEECGYWCEKQPDLVALPAASAESLLQAVEENNPSRLAALRATPPIDTGSGLVTVTLHACPNCDQSFADVFRRTIKGKETKLKALLKKHRVSPEMVQAIRPALPTAAAEPGAE
jgi:hypothetical protein